ncbi:glycosyltransferase family 2 protein [Phenylobacterium sp.]|uniref:glycosyltransferase family 2 protein n=1 Tax=Phenylobacterium sp. TaxID=1871053 RepID=UPI0035AEA33C
MNAMFNLLVAVHNRRATTRRFLDRVYSDGLCENIRIWLLDDGSTDGTLDMVQERYPSTRILRGDGSLFWNGAMAQLVQASFALDSAATVLANDDIDLRPGKLREMLSTWETLQDGRPTVLVGRFVDPELGGTSYSGLRLPNRLRPAALITVPKSDEFEQCDTFQGNLVVIPTPLLRTVGGLDAAFTHAYGDVDLGFRLGRAGARLLVYPGYVGDCAKGPSLRQRAQALKLSARYRLLFGPLRSPRDHARFLLKHSPLLAPIALPKLLLQRLAWVIKP